jgi:hypothetical protein
VAGLVLHCSPNALLPAEHAFLHDADCLDTHALASQRGMVGGWSGRGTGELAWGGGGGGGGVVKRYFQLESSITLTGC